MTENQLRDRAYKIACEHGWHNEEHPDTHWIMMIITEIAEAVQADRKDKHADRDQYVHLIDYALHEDMLAGAFLEQYKKEAFENLIKDTYEDELADICIRCYDLAGLRKFDFDTADYVYFSGCYYQDMMTKPTTEFLYCITHLLTIMEDVDFDRINAVINLIDDYAGRQKIPLLWYIKEKMKYNEKRPYKHGCKY